MEAPVVESPVVESLAKTKEQDIRELADKAVKFMNEVLDFADIDHGDGVDMNAILWAENKYSLIQSLRKSQYWDEDMLRLSIPVDYSYMKSEDERLMIYRNLLDTIGYYSENDDKVDLNVLIDLLKKSVNSSSFAYPSPLFQNETVTSDEELLLIKEPLGFTRVQSGMKYSRLFKKLIESVNPTVMGHDEVNRRYTEWTESLALQKRNYRFLLSVNPADYLLMSYGNSWTSCHIIAPHISKSDGTHGGCYKAGCLSYMVDKMTTISFVLPEKTTDEEVTLKPKIARRVVFINNKELSYFASRIYPYADNEVYRQMFKETVETLLTDVFKGEVTESLAYVWKRASAYVEQEDDLHYADYSRFSSTGDSSAFRQPISHVSDLHFVAGKKPFCLQCGNHMIEISDGLSCEWCKGNRRADQSDEDVTEDVCCECCEDYHDREDSYYIETDHGEIWVCSSCYDDYYRRCNGSGCNLYICTEDDDARMGPDDEWYCSGCYDERFSMCYSCEEDYYSNDMIEANGEWYCPNCYGEEFMECHDCGEAVRIDDSNDIDGHAYCNDCVYTCSNCGEVRPYSENDRYDGMCPSCYEEAEAERLEAEEQEEEPVIEEPVQEPVTA
jgi:hypothetical protein